MYLGKTSMHYIFVLCFLFWEKTRKVFNFCGAFPHFPSISFGEHSVAKGSPQHLSPTEKNPNVVKTSQKYLLV